MGENLAPSNKYICSSRKSVIKKKKTGFKLWFVVLKQYGHECLIVIMFSTPKLSFDLTYF